MIVSLLHYLLDYQMQMMPETWHWQHDHILTMLIHEALLYVLTYSSIFIVGLQLFPYMKVDCLCFELIYARALNRHSGWNSHIYYAQRELRVVLRDWDTRRI